MAFGKFLFDRLLTAPKSATRSVIKNCRISSSSSSSTFQCPSTRSWDLSQQKNSGSSIIRRWLHKRALHQPDIWTYPIVDGLIKNLIMNDSGKERLNLDVLMSPSSAETRQDSVENLSVEDVRKLLKLAQLETVKMRLKDVEESWIVHERFVEICSEDCGKEEGLVIAKILDESGAVIVLGNMVFMHPHQVVKTIQGLIPAPAAVQPNDVSKNELQELELEKAAIDKKAEDLVRRELWCGLAFIFAQTAGFMRLTFWELTWDVMEPICFYITSIYFMAGYTFFLKTSKEPSFEGFYQSRLNSKQRKLMKLRKFDIERYNELKKTCFIYDPLPFDPSRGQHDGGPIRHRPPPECPLCIQFCSH